jgi:hypothetical protein
MLRKQNVIHHSTGTSIISVLYMYTPSSDRFLGTRTSHYQKHVRIYYHLDNAGALCYASFGFDH